jgi:ribosome biogenesis GTPase
MEQGQCLTRARVACEHRSSYEVLTPEGPLRATLAGRFLHEARARDDLPAVGDWVHVDARRREGTATIHSLLPRTSVLARRACGSRGEVQVLAANVDGLFVVTSLNADLNERRLDRYLALARDSNVEPVLVLTKADLVPASAGAPDLAHLRAPVVVTSARTGQGIEELRRFFLPDRTVALLGSSGAGKSSLVNAILGEERQAVLPIDENDRGRHATTRRELMPLAGGGAIVDTPGLRELQLLSGGVEDVDEVGLRCRFTDCRHDGEPGCAVADAIAAGEIDEGRLESWRKIVRVRRREEWKERRRDRAVARKDRPRTRGDWE